MRARLRRRAPGRESRQAGINEAPSRSCRHALVVRLKGGDLLNGRGGGGEHSRAGVTWIVPGVTSALAAPAAGIRLTLAAAPAGRGRHGPSGTAPAKGVD
jgi:siroheme synthase